MKKLTFLFLLISFTTSAKTYYVATNGSDSNTGTDLSTPFRTIAKAAGLVAAGDQIYVRGGTYTGSSTLTLSKSGTANAPIRLEGYSDERVLMTGSSGKGISLSGSYWYVKGLDVYKAGNNGMHISGAYNTVEFCSFYDNGNSGFQLSNGAHDNRVINCDSYWNADKDNYTDADGFACKMDVGTNNYFYGCRVWLNVDDGWDGYLRGADDVSTVVENCWTWMNGWTKDMTDYGYHANGQGFKMGGSDQKNFRHNFTLKNCVAFDNKANGIDQNNNLGTMIVQNCTSFRNNKVMDYTGEGHGICSGANYSVYMALATGKTCSIVNCISVTGSASIAEFANQTTNSWQTPFTVTEDDFISLDTTGVSGPRQVDGSLPLLDFLRLNSTSDLVDAGTDIGLVFKGVAPDLGAYEHDNGSSLIRPLSKDRIAFFSGEKLVISFTQTVAGTLPCKLCDLNGQMVLQSELTATSNTLDCTGLNKGIYLLELSDRGGRQLLKVIK